MTFLQCSFKSEVLKMEQPLNVLIPKISMLDNEKKRDIEREGFPVLYLLHGLSDDHTVWMRMTSIERYATEYGIAVVMPNVNRSFYVDMKHGGNYYTYITKEIPHFVRSNFPISAKREDNYIAGLSMGGYGAFMIALRNPEMFSAAASLSGALDLTPVFDMPEEEVAPMVQAIFGSKDEYINTDYNLIRLLKKLQGKSDNLPRLFQCCGTEDYIYFMNQNFREAAEKYGINLTYEEGPGEHEWGYWDTNIQRALNWFFKL
jgi:putative tributyrin esterase